MMPTILRKIDEYKAKIAVIGIGYVGLPMALEMAKKNCVVAFDTDKEKISMLKAKKSYIDDISDLDVESVIKSGNLVPTSSENDLKNIDCYIVCVPTPLNNNKEPELKYMVNAANTIAKYLSEGNLVIYESTTYPGTTEELIKPLLEQFGMICDRDFFLAFSPERVDPGNIKYKTTNTTKVVGGTSSEATEIAAKLYSVNLECDVYPVSSPTVAEMSKILENTYRNINIGLINEFAIICYNMGIDIWEVIDAAKTKPFGFQAFYPGPGVGGHCIPLDPMYLSWKVKEYGLSATMIEASSKIIDHMPDYVVQRASEILNENQKPVNGSKILVVGVAYKANISDCRESPSLHIIKELENRKAIVDTYDPFVKKFEIDGISHKTIDVSSKADEYDLVIILVDHSGIDYGTLLELQAPIFDTKNALKEYESNQIIKL